MASRPKTLPRTLQYWRLDNVLDTSGLPETDWPGILAALHGRPHKLTVDGQELTGTIKALNVPSENREDLRTDDARHAPEIADRTTTYGIILAGNKDYVPNQQHRDTGAQQAMDLAGEKWDPVDNLFVWFCPFGNFFGVISESVSSPRPAVFAEWLTKVLIREGLVALSADKFALEASAVIDKERSSFLNRAGGLKSVNVAGNIGSLVVDASGVGKIFGGSSERLGALRVEIKVSTVRGVSSEEDERTLLDFYNETFGPLAGDMLKAQVKTSSDYQADIPPTEIDLLHHRLTRSTNVRLTNGATRAFEALTTLQQIVSAFGKDRSDLLRIRNGLLNAR
jgi:hypothetical protein